LVVSLGAVKLRGLANPGDGGVEVNSTNVGGPFYLTLIEIFISL
jgi:hypothetical protein